MTPPPQPKVLWGQVEIKRSAVVTFELGCLSRTIELIMKRTVKGVGWGGGVWAVPSAFLKYQGQKQINIQYLSRTLLTVFI